MKPQLAASVYGEGPDIILLHGLFGSRDNLRSLGKMLAGQYRIHALDLRNHGSAFHARTMTYAEMAQDVIEYIEFNHINTVCIIGHSMGGKVAMQAGLMHPECVQRLVIMDIAPVEYVRDTRSGRHAHILAGLERLNRSKPQTRSEADNILKSYIDEASTRAFILKNLKKNDAGNLDLQLNVEGIINNYSSIVSAPTGEIPYVHPVLFVKGELSDYMQEQYRSQTLRLFPLARLEVIKGAGHWLHAEKPHDVYEVIARFLTKHAWQ